MMSSRLVRSPSDQQQEREEGRLGEDPAKITNRSSAFRPFEELYVEPFGIEEAELDQCLSFDGH